MTAFDWVFWFFGGLWSLTKRFVVGLFEFSLGIGVLVLAILTMGFLSGLGVPPIVAVVIGVGVAYGAEKALGLSLGKAGFDDIDVGGGDGGFGDGGGGGE